MIFQRPCASTSQSRSNSGAGSRENGTVGFRSILDLNFVPRDPSSFVIVLPGIKDDRQQSRTKSLGTDAATIPKPPASSVDSSPAPGAAESKIVSAAGNDKSQNMKQVNDAMTENSFLAVYHHLTRCPRCLSTKVKICCAVDKRSCLNNAPKSQTPSRDPTTSTKTTSHAHHQFIANWSLTDFPTGSEGQVY